MRSGDASNKRCSSFLYATAAHLIAPTKYGHAWMLADKKLHRDRWHNRNGRVSHLLVKGGEQVKAAGELRLGEPRDAICRAVEEEKADLLVMGSHGYGVLTRYVITHSLCHRLVTYESGVTDCTE